VFRIQKVSPTADAAYAGQRSAAKILQNGRSVKSYNHRSMLQSSYPSLVSSLSRRPSLDTCLTISAVRFALVRLLSSLGAESMIPFQMGLLNVQATHARAGHVSATASSPGQEAGRGEEAE
jgi:hypothetical protein